MPSQKDANGSKEASCSLDVSKLISMLWGDFDQQLTKNVRDQRGVDVPPIFLLTAAVIEEPSVMVPEMPFRNLSHAVQVKAVQVVSLQRNITRKDIWFNSQ